MLYRDHSFEKPQKVFEQYLFLMPTWADLTREVLAIEIRTDADHLVMAAPRICHGYPDPEP